MSASSASSLGTDALAPRNRGRASRLSHYETTRSVAVVSEHDAAQVNGSNIAANRALERIVRVGTRLAATTA